jgi:uncharacterized membrane protein
MKLLKPLCFGIICLPNVAVAQVYEITELGTLSATVGDDVRSGDINNRGHVHGDNDKTGPVPGTYQTRSYLWDGATQLEVFPTVSGTTWKGAANDLGQCVGYQTMPVGSSPELHGYLWDSVTGTADLDFGLRGFTRCFDINNNGVITGLFTSEFVHNLTLQYRAFVYHSRSNTFRELPTLGGRESKATAINNNNIVVGTTYDASGGQQGFVWSYRGGMVAIPGMRYPQDINDNGIVVGYDIDSSGLIHPYSYDFFNNLLTPLPLPIGYTAGSANGNNCFGQAVGYGKDASGAQHAILWSDTNTVTVISTIINNAGSWSITGASNINDLQEISGTGKINGLRRAYKLTPVLAQPIISEFLPGRSSRTATLFGMGFTPNVPVALFYGGQGLAFTNGVIIASAYSDSEGRVEFGARIPSRAANITAWLMATENYLANPSVAIRQLFR